MDTKYDKSAKQCVNCPGRTDHDTADCPLTVLREWLSGDRPGWDIKPAIRALLTAQPQASAEIPFAGFDPNFCPGSNPENPQTEEDEPEQASAAQSARKPPRKTWRAGNPSYLCHHCNTPLMMHEQQLYCPEGPVFASNSTAAQSAPVVPEGLSAGDATELALLREYRLSGIAFNNAHEDEYTLEQSNLAEVRMEAAEKACWEFYRNRDSAAQAQPTEKSSGAPEGLYEFLTECVESRGGIVIGGELAEKAQRLLNSLSFTQTKFSAELCAASSAGCALVPLEIIRRFPELNPSNYDHDDACALNSWGVELVLASVPAQCWPLVPVGWSLELIGPEEVVKLTRKDGKWCGVTNLSTSPRDELLYWFLRAMLAAAPAQPAAQGEFGDAYQGAREDLAIWKRRALEAEAKVRHQDQIIDHLTLEAQGESRMGEPVIPAAHDQGEVQRLREPTMAMVQAACAAFRMDMSPMQAMHEALRAALAASTGQEV